MHNPDICSVSHIVRGAKKKKKKIHSRLFFFPAPPDCSLFSVKNYLKINLSNSLQKLENQGCYLWDKTWSRSTHKENRETDREFVWILTSNLQLYFVFFCFFAEITVVEQDVFASLRNDSGYYHSLHTNAPSSGVDCHQNHLVLF